MQESKQETEESKRDKREKLAQAKKLKKGRIYYDNDMNREVEFGYIGGGWDAVCYEPGDSGGGMQSAFLVDPRHLTPTARKICKECGQEVNG